MNKAEKKAKVSELASRLGKLTEEQKLDFIANVGIHNPDGHILSLNNTCMLLMQRPSNAPTVVAGYRQRLKNSRQVRKGEHGMIIWVPGRKAKNDDEELEQDQVIRFATTTVFDISQTDAA